VAATEASVAELSSGKQGPLSFADLQQLFLETREQLHRYLCRRTENVQVAADLTQELYLKLSSIRAPIPDSNQGRAYLFRMAGNLAIDHRRSEARKAELLSGSQVLFEDTDLAPDQVVASEDELRQFELAIAELPPRCGEILILSRVLGVEHEEIARRLGVSLSLVEKYQRRALRHCQKKLERCTNKK
jgi:RNA polymerase sigma factor (sigma-70 family)